MMSAKAKTVSVIFVTAVVAWAAGFFVARNFTGASASQGAAGPNAARKIKFYQSPMHPWIKSDQPGKCTICGMDLAPVYEGDAGFDSGGGKVITLPSTTATVIGIETSAVSRGKLTRTLRVTGVLGEDETRHRVLSARVPGRIEKLFINTLGAQVDAGAPLATIYSPDMLTAQRHYVERLRAQGAFTEAERSEARERLMLLGLEPDDIATLEKTQTPSAIYALRAPSAGTVVSRAVYEGQYVQTNDKLFEIGDFSHLWFVFDAYEADLAWLRVGQVVDVSVPSLQEVISAPIDFIDPTLNEATRTARVRVILDNESGRFLNRQTAYGYVHVEMPDVLLVPRTALLFTQSEPMVYLDKTGNAYEPRFVKLGAAGDAFYAVDSGVREGDRVVTQGALLIDGQAQLARSAMGGRTPAEDNKMAHAASEDIAELKPLVLASADAGAALAADDLASYEKLLPELKRTFAEYAEKNPDAKNGALAQFTTGLKSGPKIKDARAAFEVFSTAVADLARAAHLHHSGIVKIYQCPMSPVLGTGRWVQRAEPKSAAQLGNPFFGSAMLECGEEVH